MESSERTVLIVCIPKGDGSIKICRDYKVTINPGLERDKYLLPKPQDYLQKLTEGMKLSKLDLPQAYQQMAM